MEYGNEAKSAVIARLVDTDLSVRERAEVAAFLAAILRPNLTYDAAQTAERRERAARSVEAVFTRLPQGKVIVRRGDEITPRAAQWIQAVRTSASDPSSWVKVTGVFVLQLLAVLAFWLDARRQRRRKRERSAAVVFGTVLATGIAVQLDALATLLDLLGKNVGDLLVGQVAALRDALIVGSGHRPAQRQRASLVAGTHGVTHGRLDPFGQGHGFIGSGGIGHESSSAVPDR